MKVNNDFKSNISKIILLAGSITALLAGCSPSPKKILEVYLKFDPYSKDRYETICEKDYVSLGDLQSYYLSPLRREHKNWKTSEIREVDRVGNSIYFEADHTHEGKSFTSTYLVVNRKEGGPCVSWSNGGRFSAKATRLVRYPSEKITIWAKVELDDYYNYDFEDRQRSHMSLKILTGSDTWDWKTVYIPYDGNEELYDHLSSKEQELVKMTVSRSYALNLDPELVDKLKKSLYGTHESSGDTSPFIGSSVNYDADLGYVRPHITDAEDILFAPTAVPVILK
ncbi:hypothetical protein KR52_09050 [Synechococcus sp. KORDI-52]|uniref:hypothetical protein n=1 Tax=Synechococcus sp. KORDI-52 TaxID=585425 RepID=UPI0004E039C1|nr:hypothetical protein [Synechococcus sp. KORDI-52]AII49290.1 hypothetical protein KR52_09050 [Synechococcus sp. KORDI-52]